jgi:hypothetical protein
MFSYACPLATNYRCHCSPTTAQRKHGYLLNTQITIYISNEDQNRMNHYARYFSFNILEKQNPNALTVMGVAHSFILHHPIYAYGQVEMNNHHIKAPFYISYVHHNTCMAKCTLRFCSYHKMSETIPDSTYFSQVGCNRISAWPISRRSGR